jgi:L-alanine-DL-glutamate epimerase-like enolase superfamily enzyme
LYNDTAAHLLAASGSPDGLLEYGIEHNPPRDEIARLANVDGWIELGDAPGLGIELDAGELERWRVQVPAW